MCRDYGGEGETNGRQKEEIEGERGTIDQGNHCVRQTLLVRVNNEPFN